MTSWWLYWSIGISNKDKQSYWRKYDQKKVTNHRECVGTYNATGLVTVSLDAYQHTQPRGNLPGLHQVQKNKACNKALERFQSSLNVWLLQSTINKLKHTGMLLRWEIMTLSVTGSGQEKNFCSLPPTETVNSNACIFQCQKSSCNAEKQHQKV